MPNVRLVIEYHGGAFHGFQWQLGQRTVQGELERVLSTLLREPIAPIYPTGRTDAGVHARRQVVNFFTTQPVDLFRLHFAVSSMLKGDLGVVKADIVPDSFNARRVAAVKQYSYRIINRPAPPTFDKGLVWHIGATLDRDRMEAEAKHFVGLHDFSSFRSANCQAKTTERMMHEAELIRSGDELCFRVVGTGFLQHMVRIMVGTLVQFGRGLNTEPSIAAVLAARSRNAAGNTAPGHGLYLDWVETTWGERQ